MSGLDPFALAIKINSLDDSLELEYPHTMGINELLKNKKTEIFRLAQVHGARNVRVFGSVARGEANPSSDVDFLVQFEQGRSLFDRIGLMQDLEELLGRRVDVVTDKNLHWYIRSRVLEEAVPL